VYENRVTYPEILVPNPAVQTIGSKVFVVRNRARRRADRAQ
jgi:hypothetical protein